MRIKSSYILGSFWDKSSISNIGAWGLSRSFMIYESDWTETEHMDRIGEKKAAFRSVIVKKTKS